MSAEEPAVQEALRVAIGSDHAGLGLKQLLGELLERQGYDVQDLGTWSTQSCDYPLFAEAVALAVARGQARFGLLVCGTGQGMAMTANRIPGVRAAVVGDTFSARASREHNDSNVLCLGARVTGPGLAEEILQAWLSTSFAGGRHLARTELMAQVGTRNAPALASPEPLP